MAKSRGRKFAELIAPTNGVFAAASLPTIALSKLANSTFSVNSESASLGGNVVLDSNDITEHTSALYFTNARADTRADARIAAHNLLARAGGTMTGNLTLGDNVNAYFGASTDLRIYHDGTNSHIINSTGELRFTGSNFAFKSDSAKLYLGASDDLQIYHDGTHSYISDQGTGNLRILAQNFQVRNPANNEAMMIAIPDSGVTLYYNNNARFATTSTGVAITGNGDFSGEILVGTQNSRFAENNLRFLSSGHAYLDHNTTGQSFIFRVSNSSSLDTTALALSSSGYVTISNAFTLPNSDGSANQVLQTNGSGTVSWGSPAGSGTITAVVAGTNLTGGATSGSATVNLATNLSGLGTIASGAITSTGHSTFKGAGTSSSGYTTEFLNSSSAQLLRVRDDGIILIPTNYLYVSSSQGIYSTGSIKARGGITNDGSNDLSISSGSANINFNSKNFTSVGTIASGAITSSGAIVGSTVQATGNLYGTNGLHTLNAAGNGWNHTINRNSGNPTASLPGGITSGAITASGNIRLNKEGTADASNQIYVSRDLEFLASGWDTNNSVARDVMWKIRNVPTASVYPDHDLQFIESDQGSDYVKFQLEGRGSNNHTDPRAATFFGNLHVEAGSGTNAGDGDLTVAGTISSGAITTSANLTSTAASTSGILGAAYSTNYFGLKTSSQTLSSEYMIISANGDTYISASSGYSVVLRYGGNDSTNQLIIGSGATGLTWRGSTVWHAANDGAGSGLDADLLDGSNGGAFMKSGAGDSVSGWWISGARNGSGSSPQVYFSHSSGYGMHINTYNTSGTIYALQLHNNTNELFEVMNDGQVRIRGQLRIGAGSNDGYFYSDSDGRTAFAGGDFYIQNSVNNYYNYATNQYLGATSGDNIYLRGNTISGNSWNITGAGAITAASLDVSGTIDIGAEVVLSESTDRADLLQISSTTSGWGGLQIRNSANEGRWSFMTNGANAGIYDDENNEWFVYLTENGSTDIRYNGSTKLATSSGGVAITGNLESVTNMYLAGYLYHNGDTNTYLRFVAADDLQLVAGGRQMIRMDEGANPDILQFVVSTTYTDSSGNIVASGNVTAYASDERLKTNIRPIENAIDKIKAIRGVHYDWIDTVEDVGFMPDQKLDNIGVIAQEIEEVLPQVVKPAPFDRERSAETNWEFVSKSGEEYKTVDYDKITALLIQGMKEQQELIEALEAKVKKLEAD